MLTCVSFGLEFRSGDKPSSCMVLYIYDKHKKKKFPRWVAIYTQCVLNGTCYKCPNDRTIYHISPLSVNDPVQVFFESDRATKRKSKYPRRERLILTDNGVCLAFEVLFDGLGGLLYFMWLQIHQTALKNNVSGFKKKRKQEIKHRLGRASVMHFGKVCTGRHDVLGFSCNHCIVWLRLNFSITWRRYLRIFYKKTDQRNFFVCRFQRKLIIWGFFFKQFFLD